MVRALIRVTAPAPAQSPLLRPLPGRLRALAAVGVAALALGGCLSRGPDTTGSLAGSEVRGDAAWREQAESWGPKFNADPGNREAALGYARALRATGQRAQAVAVLQAAALRHPHDTELLSAYGKALGDVGRLKEAAQVLENAHTPEQPDWRVLSAQGAIADQMDDHPTAQRYYEAALRIVPGEPGVLSNLGLSYALSRRLPEAERTLRTASASPRADARVRQNLALVLGLQGRFGEAEEVLRRDLSGPEASANVASLRRLVAQPNAWRAIRGADKAAGRTAAATAQGAAAE